MYCSHNMPQEEHSLGQVWLLLVLQAPSLFFLIPNNMTPKLEIDFTVDKGHWISKHTRIKMPALCIVQALFLLSLVSVIPPPRAASQLKMCLPSWCNGNAYKVFSNQ